MSLVSNLRALIDLSSYIFPPVVSTQTQTAFIFPARCQLDTSSLVAKQTVVTAEGKFKTVKLNSFISDSVL